MTGDSLKPTSIQSMCDRHDEIERRREQIYSSLPDVEAMLVDRHDWLNLTRVQRRALPAARALYDLEDELEQLDRESSKLVVDLVGSPAVSVGEAIAKLEVVARVIEPDDYLDAHTVLTEAISELHALSGL